MNNWQFERNTHEIICAMTLICELFLVLPFTIALYIKETLKYSISLRYAYVRGRTLQVNEWMAVKFQKIYCLYL